MNGLRKGLVFLLCPLLFAVLVGLAVSVSSNINLKNPDKIEAWLSSSKLYDHFVSNATKQAQKSAGDNDNGGSVSLSDTAVQAAAQSAFSPQLIEQNVNAFIDANYAWLKGKTDTPEFNIDLSSAKTTFAEKVGKYVTTYTAGLPICTTLAQAQSQIDDPLSATCRPPNVTPEQAGAEVKQQIETGDFLSNPVITADTFNSKDNPNAQPYYKKLARLPQIYRLGVNLPYVLGGLVAIFMVGLILLSKTRRSGFKKTAWVLTIAGAFLVAAKFSSDIAFNQLKQRAFNNSSIGDLQTSLTTFAHTVESALTRTEMLFGIGYLIVAIIIFIVLIASRNEGKASVENATPTPQPSSPKPSTPATSRISLGNSIETTATTPTLAPKPKPAPKPKSPSKPKRRPRLIQ